MTTPTDVLYDDEEDRANALLELITATERVDSDAPQDEEGDPDA
jgi:hypothetical protein